MPICGVIFDLDGLMVDSEPLSREAWRILLETFNHSLRDETVEEILGLRLLDSARIVKQCYELPLTVEETMVTKRRIHLEIMRGKLEPMPGLFSLLDAIRARGLPMAVATSSEYGYAKAVLEEIGADGFTAIITGDRVDRGKPAPDVYLKAAERMGLNPTQCLALEDSVNGIKAAHAAGMRCVAIPNGVATEKVIPEALWVFSSLEKVVDQLDILLNK